MNETKAARKRAPGAGRPPEGDHGTRVADYVRLAVRLPPTTTARLKAWADVTGQPQWKLIAQAVEAAVAQLPPEDAGDVKRLATRYVKRYREE
jgi:hypothetical protein